MHSRSNNIKFTSYNHANELLINYLIHLVKDIKKTLKNQREVILFLIQLN